MSLSPPSPAMAPSRASALTSSSSRPAPPCSGNLEICKSRTLFICVMLVIIETFPLQVPPQRAGEADLELEDDARDALPSRHLRQGPQPRPRLHLQGHDQPGPGGTRRLPRRGREPPGENSSTPSELLRPFHFARSNNEN